MAKAVYEQRNFTSNRGEIIKYDWYGVQATVNGEYMELKLENLNSAEKVAFKMIATGTDPKNYSVVSGKASEDEAPTVTKNEVDEFFKQKETDDNKINLEEDD